MAMIAPFRRMASPVGVLTLVGGDGGLRAVLWENDDPARVRLPPLVESADDPLLILSLIHI